MNKSNKSATAAGGFSSVQDLLTKYKSDDKSITGLPPEYSRDKYVSREFQKYGYDLAQEMNDPDNIPLYIKLAKTTDRGVLEKAKSFVKDAPKVKNKTALFLWKMKQLKIELKSKKDKNAKS